MKTSPHLIALALLLTLGLSSLQAQDADPPQTHKHEFGIDLSYLMQQYVWYPYLGDLGINTWADYLLSYQYRCKHMSLRSGLGVRVQNGTSESGGQESTNNSWNVDFRLGVGRIWTVAPKWEVQAGVDVLGNIYDSESISTNYESTSGGWQGGGGPFAALYFRPHPRIALWTETALYATQQHADYTNMSGGYSSESSSDQFTMQLRAPTSLFVSVFFGQREQE